MYLTGREPVQCGQTGTGSYGSPESSPKVHLKLMVSSEQTQFLNLFLNVFNTFYFYRKDVRCTVSPLEGDRTPGNGEVTVTA